MELILTSFGLSHLRPVVSAHDDIFYGMPPVSWEQRRQLFVPDHAVLLLCERIVVDSESFHRLSSGDHHASYGEVADVLRALYDEGFVRIEDFREIVSRKSSLLNRMLLRDLESLDAWVEPLNQSLANWGDFLLSMTSRLAKDGFSGTDGAIVADGWDAPLDAAYDVATHGLHAIWWVPAHLHRDSFPWKYHVLREAVEWDGERRLTTHRQVLRETLTDYLSYANANLVLSHTLGVGFHDWPDFEPFYRVKFLGVGQEDVPEQQRVGKLKQLFEVSFPEFASWDAKSIVKALKDKRIVDLRVLVNEAVEKGITFDQKFAHRVLREVVGIETHRRRVRKIVSWATLPLALIPRIGTVVQKGVEEIAVRLAEEDVGEGHRWFYLISELGSDPNQPPLHGNQGDGTGEG